MSTAATSSNYRAVCGIRRRSRSTARLDIRAHCIRGAFRAVSVASAGCPVGLEVFNVGSWGSGAVTVLVVVRGSIKGRIPYARAAKAFYVQFSYELPGGLRRYAVATPQNPRLQPVLRKSAAHLGRLGRPRS